MAGTESFPVLLRDQIRHGFTAAQQCLAVAVYFDSHRLPQLAKHCYHRSELHRAHALRMIQYLLDRELEVRVGNLGEVQPDFESPRAALMFLQNAENAHTAQITELAGAARAANDYLGERFVQWFLKEQVDNVARVNTLLAVIDRGAGDLFDVEEFIAREMQTPARQDRSAPKMAGAATNN
ncbi:ferritin [Nocardia sp. XZ_19_385]|uniref:ferritin n=1 Tax=Nocardia sp. XZ_19_385 TaxID=2769488 RepID=UPI00188F069B|nr:ferritin-like domain-containing protein [Nocardia sp. XZ_19_385]